MMSLKELREKRAKLEVELDAIMALAEPTEGNETRLAELLDVEIPGLDKQIDVRVRAEEQKASRKKAAPTTVAHEEHRQQSEYGSSFEVTQDEIDKDPCRGFKTPRAFLTAVMDATRRGGGELSPGLNYLSVARLGKEFRTAGSDEGSTFSDPYGGFLVPEGHMPTLLKIDASPDPIAGLTRNIPMSTPSLKIHARVDKTHTTSVSGGLRVYRRAESAEVTASRMAFEEIDFRAHELMAVSYATQELLSDSAQSFVALLGGSFQDEFNAKIISERINGTGVGEFLGIMNSDALITETATGAADTVLYEDVVNMMSRCWGYGNAVWMCNHEVIPKLAAMALVVGTGGSGMWQPNAREGTPSSILGRPLIVTEYCAALSTTGDILLVNWGEYLEGLLTPLESAESMHVRFLSNEMTFRFYMRNAGMPWWRSYLTPKNGPTLSPFVALATRT